MSLDIRDRIVEFTRIKASDLTPHPQNWRKHPKAQQDAMSGILKEVGYVDAIMVREHEGGYQIIDGHLRAETTPDATVPVLVVDLDDAETALVLATFDPLAAMAEASAEHLDALLQQVNTTDTALQGMLADVANNAGLYAQKHEQDAEPRLDEADELNQTWQVKTGDIWLVGKHRLMCGDSTKAEDVAGLMAGNKADLCVTDPPYNINYGNIKHPKFKQRSIENDNMTRLEFGRFCASFISGIKAHVTGCVYVFGPPGPDGRVMFTELDSMMHCSTTIVWNKDQFTLGRGKYQNKYEPCWFGWVESGSAFSDDRTLTNVWDFARPRSSEEHPTMKPVALIANAIGHASSSGCLVYDPFLGSGTTLIAAEQLNRKCYGMEISPAYCAVILQRAADAFPEMTITRQ